MDNKKTTSEKPTQEQLLETLKKCFKTEWAHDCEFCFYSGGKEPCLECVARDVIELIEEKDRIIDAFAYHFLITSVTLNKATNSLSCSSCVANGNCFEQQKNGKEITETGCASMLQILTIRALERKGAIKYISAKENKEMLELMEKTLKEKGCRDADDE